MRVTLGRPFAIAEFPPPVPEAMARSISMPQGLLPSSKKVKWSEREDQILAGNIQKYGTINWSVIACGLPGRTGKQCRERWANQLDPTLNRDSWTPSEDSILIAQQQNCGNCWSKIGQFLPRRSANAIKNRWCWLARHHANTPRMAEPQQADPAPIPAGDPRPRPPDQQFFTPRELFEKSDPFALGLSDFSWE
jgi:hypothetical protein